MIRARAILLVVALCAAASGSLRAAEGAAAAEYRALDVPVYVDINRGERVGFTLRSGERREIELASFDAKAAEILLDGERVKLGCEPFAEPVAVRGVRVAVEITSAWSDRMRWKSFNLSKDCRLFLSDAAGAVMANPPGVYPLRPAPVLNNGRGGGWLSARRPGEKDCHIGFDTYGPMGTEVVACEAGKVVSVGTEPYVATGRFVVVEGRRFTWSYLHLATVEVKPGDELAAGARLGMMGQSGWVRPHLHVQMSPAGAPAQVNPQHFMREMFSAPKDRPTEPFRLVDVKYVDAAGAPVEYAELFLGLPDGRTLPCDRTSQTAVLPGRYALTAVQHKLGLRGEAAVEVKDDAKVTILMEPAQPEAKGVGQ